MHKYATIVCALCSEWWLLSSVPWWICIVFFVFFVYFSSIIRINFRIWCESNDESVSFLTIYSVFYFILFSAQKEKDIKWVKKHFTEFHHAVPQEQYEKWANKNNNWEKARNHYTAAQEDEARWFQFMQSVKLQIFHLYILVSEWRFFIGEKRKKDTRKRKTPFFYLFTAITSTPYHRNWMLYGTGYETPNMDNVCFALYLLLFFVVYFVYSFHRFFV